MSTAQKQIDRLAETLQNAFNGKYSNPIVQGHATLDHLTVFQEDDRGTTHQLLLGITYIGELSDEPSGEPSDEPIGEPSDEPTQPYDSLSEINRILKVIEKCKASGLHLTSRDDDGYCSYCGDQLVR